MCESVVLVNGQLVSDSSKLVANVSDCPEGRSINGQYICEAYQEGTCSVSGRECLREYVK